MTLYWLRDEARPTERRTPIVPDDARRLVAAGHDLVVEASDKRIFDDAAYGAAGARLVPPGSWHDAPLDAVVLGVKELPDEPAALRHRFVHFAHIFKDQTGWRDELGRFHAGDGTLYDIEFLVDDDGRRLAAFSYWAGWLGAAIGLMRLLERRLGLDGVAGSVAPFSGRAEVTSRLSELVGRAAARPTALVVGARGKSGRGAVEVLTAAGLAVTEWDMAETADLDRDALLSHDLLVNCVLMTGPGLVLVTPEDLKRPQTLLSMISDVSCDPRSDYNPLPVYDRPTSWTEPVILIGPNGAGEAAEITAIDNLPSLMPLEASSDFSTNFLPALLRFPEGPEWAASLQAFEATKARAGLGRGQSGRRDQISLSLAGEGYGDSVKRS